MSFLRGSHPCGVTEAYTFDGDVAHRAVGGAYYLNKRLHNRIDGCDSFFAVAWIVIYFSCSVVMIPFPWTVEQFLGISEIKW